MIRLENGESRPNPELRDRIVAATGTEEQIESDDDEDEDLLMVLDRPIKRTQRLRRETGDPHVFAVTK